MKVTYDLWGGCTATSFFEVGRRPEVSLVDIHLSSVWTYSNLGCVVKHDNLTRETNFTCIADFSRLPLVLRYMSVRAIPIDNITFLWVPQTAKL